MLNVHVYVCVYGVMYHEPPPHAVASRIQWYKMRTRCVSFWNWCLSPTRQETPGTRWAPIRNWPLTLYSSVTFGCANQSVTLVLPFKARKLSALHSGYAWNFYYLLWLHAGWRSSQKKGQRISISVSDVLMYNIVASLQYTLQILGGVLHMYV